MGRHRRGLEVVELRQVDPYLDRKGKEIDRVVDWLLVLQPTPFPSLSQILGP